MRIDRSSQRFGPSVAFVVAGVLAMVSRVPHWATVSFPGGAGGSTVTSPVGHAPAGLYLGVILIVRGLIGLTAREDRASSWLAFGLLSGLLLAGFAVYDLVRAKHDAIEQLVSDVASRTHLPPAAIRAVVDQQLATGVLRFSFTYGLYLALVASAIAIVAGVISVRHRASASRAAPSGPRETGISDSLGWAPPRANDQGWSVASPADQAAPDRPDRATPSVATDTPPPETTPAPGADA